LGFSYKRLDKNGIPQDHFPETGPDEFFPAYLHFSVKLFFKTFFEVPLQIKKALGVGLEFDDKVDVALRGLFAAGEGAEDTDFGEVVLGEEVRFVPVEVV